MNKKLTVLLAGLAACVEAPAQSIAPQVLSNCGASASSADFRMDWTFGEFAIATIGNSQYHITQGFHQPYSGTVGIEETIPTNATAWIWPNPAGNELNLGVSEPMESGTTVRVLGMDGKLLLSFKTAAGRTTVALPIGSLAAGSYLLVIDNAEGVGSTHRFIKTP